MLIFFFPGVLANIPYTREVPKCGGFYITPLHILTTAKCAILLKQNDLHPIRINHKFRSNSPNFSSIREAQNFNISEIYLHPSHTKRKQSTRRTIEHLPKEEYKTSKDVALLQISSSKQRISYLRALKTVQLEAISNNRQLKQIKNRGNKVVSFNIQSENSNNTKTNILNDIEWIKNRN